MTSHRKLQAAIGAAFVLSACVAPGAYAADLSGGAPIAADTKDWLSLDVGAGAVTDLRFRGVSYSNGKPAVYGYAQAHLADWVYAGVFASTVDYPARYGLSDPDMKLNFYGGLKHDWENISLESGAIYYYYPGENPFPGARQTDYWELYANPTVRLSPSFSVAGSINWTSDWLNTDADVTYLSVSPKLQLDPIFGGAVKPYVSGGFGALFYKKSKYFRNPKDYIDWNVGGGFTVNNATFDLRYVDTNLTRSNCAIDDGHRSWCGATVIAKMSVDFNFK